LPLPMRLIPKAPGQDLRPPPPHAEGGAEVPEPGPSWEAAAAAAAAAAAGEMPLTVKGKAMAMPVRPPSAKFPGEHDQASAPSSKAVAAVTSKSQGMWAPSAAKAQEAWPSKAPPAPASASQEPPSPWRAKQMAMKREAAGTEAMKASESMVRTVFIDELPMPSRPKVGPCDTDREVFACRLPADLRNEEKLREWLGADFGPVEYVFFLRDRPDAEPNGRAYIRFQQHDAAALYIEAEGDGATWSESERARQRSRNVYGSDLYAAFFGSDGHILPSLVSQAGVRQLWASSEVKPPRGVSSPFKARQLHFFTECNEQEFERVRSTLEESLRTFHEQSSHFAEAQDRLRRGDAGAPQPKRKSGPQSLSWDPATGKYVEEDLPADLQELINGSGGQHTQPTTDATKGGFQAFGKGGEKGGVLPPGKGASQAFGKGGEKGGELPPGKGCFQAFGKGGEKGGEPLPGKGASRAFSKGGEKGGEPPLGKGCFQAFGKGGEKGGEPPPGTGAPQAFGKGSEKGGELPLGKGGFQAFGKGVEKGGELPPGKGACQAVGKGGCQPLGKGCEPLPGKGAEPLPGKGGCQSSSNGEEVLPGKGGCPVPGKGGEAAFDKGGEPGRPRLPQPAGKGSKPSADGMDGRVRLRPPSSLLDCIDLGKADAKLLDLTERGETLVGEGRALAQQGQAQRAIERYREGLRLLMQTVPEGVDERSSNVSEVDRLRLQRISDHMSAMEALSVAAPQPEVPAVPAVMGAGAGHAGGAGEDGSGRRPRRSRWN